MCEAAGQQVIVLWIHRWRMGMLTIILWFKPTVSHCASRTLCSGHPSPKWNPVFPVSENVSDKGNKRKLQTMSGPDSLDIFWSSCEKMNSVKQLIKVLSFFSKLSQVNNFGRKHGVIMKGFWSSLSLRMSQQQVFDFQKWGYDCFIMQPNMHTKYSPASPAEVQNLSVSLHHMEALYGQVLLKLSLSARP